MRSRVFEKEAKGNDAGACRGSGGGAVHGIQNGQQKPATVLDRKSILKLYDGDSGKEKYIL